MNKEEKFLKEYVNTPSPSGFEMVLGGQQVWMGEVKPFVYEVKTDLYGNAYAYYNKPNKDKKTILIDAHADEIGYIVSDIKDDGSLRINRLGGSDIQISLASRVDVWVEKGKSIDGVFANPAIHVKEKDFKPEVHNSYIDIGVSSKEEVEKLGIEIGSPITMKDGYLPMKDYYVGRSLDDKIGGFITSRVLKKLSEKKVELPFNLIVVNAVMEEVGLFGAAIASNTINPDIAIAIDVCHDTTTPHYNRDKQGNFACGKGVVLMNSPSVQKNLLKLIKETAKEKSIDFQLVVSGSSSGTNTDRYFLKGIPSALISLPMKYMHSPSEFVSKKDVKTTIELLYETIISGKLTDDLSF